MPRDKADIAAALQRKGFAADNRDHLYLIYHTRGGKKSPVKTKLSHTPKMKVVPDALLARMARQCQVTKAQFLELVDCTLDQAGYELLLIERGQVDRPDGDPSPTNLTAD
ncbi:MAG: hypothetical protein H7338_01045 [Candidatus Sericytochromatia bacterium]|nr:hypothetical protein [Candidatus Sericytochromatia bacterium]